MVRLDNGTRNGKPHAHAFWFRREQGLKDTLGYRSSKFVTRHKLGVGAAAAVVFLLLAGVSAIVRQGRIAFEKWHPQEREHSDAEGGTRDRVQRRDRLRGHPGQGQ